MSKLSLLPARTEAVREAVARVSTVAEGLEVRARAEALKVYAQRQGLADQVRALTEIVLRLDRKVGGMLEEPESPKDRGAKGGKSGGRGNKKPAATRRPFAAKPEPAITHQRATELRRLSEIPEAAFDAALARPKLPSRATLLQGQVRREVEARSASEAPTVGPGLYRGDLTEVPGGRYRCLYADPPWAYGDAGKAGAAEQHYPTMEPEELCALDLGRLAHPEGCHLWLWTTWPKIRDGVPHQVLDAWGFRWVGEAVWVKDRIGTGHWLRGITEVLVLAVKGTKSAFPLLVNDQPGLIQAARTGHSVKPPEARAIVERCSPGPRLELFARDVPAGWDAWGNQCRR